MADDDTPRRAAGSEDNRARGAAAAEQRPDAPEAAGAGAGTPENAGEDTPDVLRSRLEELEQKVESYRDQALRAQAEAENTRRRASRDVEHAHKFALEKFTAELLPVIDSLEKAVEAASDSESAGAIAEGVELSLKLFLSVLEKHGIEQIDPAGEPFDPQVHEAMTMVPSHHAEPNSVVEVMQRGYLLNGRLVRAAKVVVARAPAPDSAP
ncbi:MAG: nucleotide exchange factor GrpE [Gammaproteobacteria bacterium]|nr:nucleotide exchange factor GrpE [Gammaproteobacteria bacterium]